MSRLTDAAAVFNVLSKVLTQAAALQRTARHEAWQASSVMRDVGHARTTIDSFVVDTDGQPKAQEPAAPVMATKFHGEAKSQEPVVPIMTSATNEASLPVQSQASSHLAPRAINQDEDIFLLRQARRRPVAGLSTEERPRPTKRSTGVASPQISWRSETPLVEPKIDSSTGTSSQVEAAHSQAEQVKIPTEEPSIQEAAEQIAAEVDVPPAQQPASALHSSAVPSSRLSRLYHYTTLGSSLAFNAFADSTKRILVGGTDKPGGLLSAKNIELLVRKLSRMRGAALKLGQMISFQSENLPLPIQQVLQKVQDSADYMPEWQLNRVLAAEFGADWRTEKFATFEDVPMAAASIGQVHKATLHDGTQVAVKVQYPGVANSISSDLNNLSILLTASRLLPKGLYLDKTIANARTELAWECDYEREADNTRLFRNLVGEDPVFKIPRVIDDCSGKHVLTTELLHGVGIAKAEHYSQATRDFLGTEIMRLCLRELVEFNFMQTDPNWTNFLYNEKTKQIELLDFGACRSFDKTFIDKYCKLLVAAAQKDKTALCQLSVELGYLTGEESSAMRNAHISSILTLAEPFMLDAPEALYDFHNQTVTDRVKSFIPVMLRERLAPPPEETYSLHRRLSGHFLLCARLRSKIPCKEIFTKTMTQHGYLQAAQS